MNEASGHEEVDDCEVSVVILLAPPPGDAYNFLVKYVISKDTHKIITDKLPVRVVFLFGEVDMNEASGHEEVDDCEGVRNEAGISSPSLSCSPRLPVTHTTSSSSM
jgi:hypothetical protein